MLTGAAASTDPVAEELVRKLEGNPQAAAGSTDPVAEECVRKLEGNPQAAAASTDPVVEELVRKLEGNPQAPSNAFLSISVVPAHSRALGDRRYTPYHVSIGPIHRRHRTELCRDAEKLSCLKYLLRENIERELVERKVHKVKVVLDWHRILECYGLKAEGSEDLVEMLLLDACYLVTVIGDGPVSGSASQVHSDRTICRGIRNLYHIIRNYMNTHRSGGAPPPPLGPVQQVQEITDNRRTSLLNDTDWALMMRDIWYLLENQIPFIVVKEIYKETCEVPPGMDVEDVFTKYAQDLLQNDCYIAGGSSPGNSNPSIYHLLHLLHTCFPKPNVAGSSSGAGPRSTSATAKAGPWRRATEYVSYSNVQFARRKLDGTNARSVLDVDIDGGKVLVPRLCINGNTWTILLNLMALEQQHPSMGSHVTAYCLFMSQIACTVEDVKLLLRADVIENHLGDPDKVAADFAELCGGVIFDTDNVNTNYLNPVWLQLEKRYRSRVHNFFSWFRLTYWSCKNLPVLMAVIAASIVLVSGAVGAVYAALTYYQPATAPRPPRSHN